MRKITIKYTFNEEEMCHTAILADDLSHPVLHPENEANGVVDGVADELGIWSIYFDDNNVEVDFICKIDEDDCEVKTLEPCEVFIWGPTGKALNDDHFLPFTVVEEQV